MEKFPTINSESLSQDSKQAGNKDIEFPEFNKAEAEENIKAYEAEHSEAHKNIETEQLCVPDKMMEQLEQLGVNQEILKNPAFNEILTDNMKYYGLQMCVPNTIEASEDKVHNGENIGEKQFSLSYSGEKGDSRYHDRGNMNIIVKEDGSLVLECACADRNKVEAKKDAFKGYEASGDYIDTIETRNNASITEFRITQDGWLATYERSAYEHQLQPASPSPSGGRNFGLYTRSMAECNRYFDVAGIEQYREDVVHDAENLEGYDFISSHLGYIDTYSADKPKNASFNALNRFKPGNVERRTSLSRNSDGTVKVEDFYQGERVVIENCEMNTEHGTDRLIPVTQAIVAAHEEAKVK